MSITLTLSNFRCWEQRTFTFPASGICLIHGRSGRGKSTILNAFFFAISGKLKNITTFGKRSTKVELSMPEFSITRTRNPMSLTVKRGDQQYLDEGAQKLIDEHFGTQFACTSYIDQDNSFSFANMGPTDKMLFLESVMMQEYSIESIHERIRDEMNQTKVRYAELDGRWATLSGLLRTMRRVNVPELRIESNKVTCSNLDKLIEKVTNNLAVCERNSKVAMNRVRKLEDSQAVWREWNMKRTTLQRRLEELSTELSELSPYSEEEKLHRMERQKKLAIECSELFKWRERLNEVRTEMARVQRENDQKREQVTTELGIIEDVPAAEIADLQEVLRLIARMTELDEQLESFDREAESAWLEAETVALRTLTTEIHELQHLIDMACKVLECPECRQSLQLAEGGKKLVKTDPLHHSANEIRPEILNERKREWETRDKAFKVREKTFTKLSALQTQFNDLFTKAETRLAPYGMEVDEEAVHLRLTERTTMMNRRQELTRQLAHLDSDRMIAAYRREETDLVRKCERDDIDMDQIVDVHTLITECTVYGEKFNRVRTLRAKHEDLSTSYARLEESPAECECNDEMLVQEREKYAEQEEKVRKYREFSTQLNEWKQLWSQREQYDKMELEVAEVREQRDLLNDRMRGLSKLRDHIKTAEKQCIEDFVQSLNAHASLYLESFFEDEDLQINLRTVQESKTGKEKIALNFEVIYRQLAGDLSYLSGGERDRVNLAYTLALSEMIHPSVLMLDECISSLDAETTGKVLDTLRSSYKGKLVLLISHQANLGFFDAVVEV